MPHSMTYLLCLAFLLASQPPGGRQPPSKKGPPSKKPAPKKKLSPAEAEAERVLDLAVNKIKQHRSYRCDLEQEIRMFGYHFRGKGRLLVGPEYRRRFELELQTTKGTTGRLVEVSDGKQHWRSVKVLDSHTVERLDLEKVLKVLNNPDFEKKSRDLVLQQLGFSGVLPVLRGLRDTQRFEKVESGTLDGRPVFVVHGRWKEKALDGTLIQGRPIATTNLPPFVPSRSTLWIGKEDGWLYRFVLEGAEPPEQSKQAGEQVSTLVRMEFAGPRFGVEFAASEFKFQPPKDVEITDRTDMLCQQLNLLVSEKRRARMQRRRGRQPPSPTTKRPVRAKPARSGTRQSGTE